MENTNYTIIAIAAVVALIIGAGIGYTMAPKTTTGTLDGSTPLEGKTIQIGYVAASTTALETVVPLVDNIITVDINNFLEKLGHDTTVEFLIDTADMQAAIHLEKVQSFKAKDVTIFLGGAWSSQASASLSYVNDNDMLMISSSSTSPLLAFANDRLFRTCPTDYVQAPAIAEMWSTWGTKAILIVQRADPWGDGIYNVLIPELESRGIEVIERVRFASDVTEFSSYLATMEELLKAPIAKYGADYVGIQTMMFDEAVVMVTQTDLFPITREVIWMGTESSGRSQRMLDDAGGLQVDIRGFSSLMTPANSWKWKKLEADYFAEVQQAASFYTATDYDAAWSLVLSVIQTQSVTANDVVEAWPDVPRNYFGASGWVDLDDNGDRKPAMFDIWGFTEDGFTSFGKYDGVKIEVMWDEAKLAEHGIVRPGAD